MLILLLWAWTDDAGATPPVDPVASSYYLRDLRRPNRRRFL